MTSGTVQVILPRDPSLGEVFLPDAPTNAVVRADDPKLQLINIPGLQGPKGDPGDGGGGQPVPDYLTTALGTVIGNHVVAVRNGLSFYPDLSNMQDVLSIVGLASNSANDGGQLYVRSQGELVESGWTWNPGPIYCAQDGGGLTQTVPTSGVLIEVARALSPTRIAVSLKLPFVRG